MNLDIFIKTYPGDHQWLPYLLQSIRKYVTGFRQVVIVTDDDPGAGEEVLEICKANDPGAHCHLGTTTSVQKLIPENVVLPPERTAWGYQQQKGIKMQWDQFTDADAVFQVDSDMMFTNPVVLLDTCFWLHPSWFRSRWHNLTVRHLDSIAAWWPGIRWFSNRLDPENYYPWYNMPMMGWVITREAVQGFQKHVMDTYGQTPVELFMDVGKPHLSVYNTFGVYLSDFSNGHGYRFLIAGNSDNMFHFLHANHSWSGMTEKAKAKIAEVLGT